MLCLLTPLLLLASPLGLSQTQAELSMGTPTPIVRSGEAVSLDFILHNPNGHLIAGYQVQWDWNSDGLEMIAAPTTLSSSVLVDLFAANAPPFGPGWTNCPDAGDGLGTEGGLALSVALSTNNQFSGGTGHLFQVPFLARQAISQDPLEFSFDGFSLCINQASILADAAGNSIPLTLTPTEVEITPNLSVTGNFHLGGNLDFEIHDQVGLPWTIGYGFIPTNRNLGSMGILFYNAFASSSGIVGNGVMATESEITSIGIPQLPGLVGRTVYTQALTGMGSARRLSNLVEFTIL